MQRLLGRVLLGLLILTAIIWLCDWASWRVRVLRGGGMGTVQVTWEQVANLKGDKQSFYPDGEGPVACAQALFPHGGANPCWYVARHPVVFEQ